MGVTDFIWRGHSLTVSTRDRFGSGIDGAVDATSIGPALAVLIRAGAAIIALRSGTDAVHERDVQIKSFSVRERAKDHSTLRQIGQQVGSGLLATRVAAVFSATEAEAAHKQFDEGGLRGRIVLNF